MLEEIKEKVFTKLLETDISTMSMEELDSYVSVLSKCSLISNYDSMFKKMENLTLTKNEECFPLIKNEEEGK